jgi:hypothetical protein
MSKARRSSQRELWRKLIETPASERLAMFSQVSQGGRRPNLQIGFEGWTLLHLAAHSGWINEVQWLLEAGANPFLKTHRNESPLELAVKRGNLEIVGLILIKMLDKAKEHSIHYKHLLRELANWYFFYNVNLFFPQEEESEEPKEISYKRRRRQKRSVEMVLRVFKEIFTEVSEEELKKRGFQSRTRSRLRWDPLWGRKGFGKSPLTYFFKRELPCRKEVCGGKYYSMSCKSVLNLLCAVVSLESCFPPAEAMDAIEECMARRPSSEWTVPYFLLYWVMELPPHLRKEIEEYYGEHIARTQAVRGELIKMFEEGIEVTLRDEVQPVLYESREQRKWYEETLCLLIPLDSFYLPPEEDRLSEERYRRALAALRKGNGSFLRRVRKGDSQKHFTEPSREGLSLPPAAPAPDSSEASDQWDDEPAQ